MMKYLASFVRKDTFFDFCLPELISVCEMYNIPLKYDSDFSFDIKNDPLIFIDIPNSSEFAQKICDRSVLTKYIIEVISSGKTYDDLIEKINKEDFLSESSSLETFKFEVDPRGKVMSQDEKLDVIEKFHILNFKGKVNLKNPKRVFIVIENDHTGIKYFGKLLAGKSQEYANYYSKYNLDQRKYLGPTSTDNVLSFLMCNLGKVKHNDTILDPFVGTGSLLIPPSHFNAITFGCDIDMRVIKGYGIGYTKPEKSSDKVSKGSDIFTNFELYNLNPPSILRMDINLPFFRYGEIFDSIICDPPYGQRAFTRKTGMEDPKKQKRQARLKEKYGELIENENKTSINVGDMVYDKSGKTDSYHFAPLKQCSIEDIFKNLLDLGDKTIVKGGNLVCLFPHKRNKGEEELIFKPVYFPQHKNFKLVYAIENGYSSLKSRWCLVYKKLF